jgi:glycerophosphoryl diester phosphodiesterase
MHPVVDPARRLVIAHRGGSGLRPENTLAAFEHGLALGADALELDVHLSRDGQAVVCHDATLDRTTNATGPIAERTARELAHVDAGWWFAGEQGYPYRDCGFGVPRLADVLERFDTVPLVIELKGEDPALARRTVEEVRARRALERVCFGSFSDALLAAARSCGPEVITSGGVAAIRQALTWTRLGLAPRRRTFQALQVPETYGVRRIVSRRFVRALARVRVPVQVWTVNDAGDMRRLLEWGVQGLITDRPDLAVPIVGEFDGRGEAGALARP